MRALKFMSVVIAAVWFAPHPVWADAIMETSSLTIPTTTLMTREETTFSTTAFPEFNPSLGTLTGVTVELTGSATWASSAGREAFLGLQLGAASGGAFGGSSNFFTAGTITLNLSDAA